MWKWIVGIAVAGVLLLALNWVTGARNGTSTLETSGTALANPVPTPTPPGPGNCGGF